MPMPLQNVDATALVCSPSKLAFRVGTSAALIALAVACGSSSDSPASPEHVDASDPDANSSANDAGAGGSDASSDDGGSDAGPKAAAATLALGRDHTCAVLDDHFVKCWGNNNDGDLGLGDRVVRGWKPKQMGDALPAVDLGAGRTALAVSAGGSHTCAVLDDHSVKCWGTNSYGELGLGDATSRGALPSDMGAALPAVDLGTGRTALAVSAGTNHTCAVLDDHSVKCWGTNGSGALGIGDGIRRGDQPGQMGDALPAVDLGAGRTAVVISAGGGHTCALLDNHAVKCWGDNSSGELGIGDQLSRGSKPNEMGDALAAVDLGTGRSALAIATGDDHSCAVLDDHSVKCWGSNYFGQLGLGDVFRRGGKADQMGDALPVVDLGAGRSALAISAGALFTCALLDNHSVKCWGNNYGGELGVGDMINRGDKPGQLGDALPAIDLGAGRSALAVSAADGEFVCALLDNHSVKCWGQNQHGELGLGDSTYRGDKPGLMGDVLPAVDLGTGRTVLVP